jgi:hypothetical protein
MKDKKFEIVGMVGDVKLTRITDDRRDKIYFLRAAMAA